MQLYTFAGIPGKLGREYGKIFAKNIQKNIDILIKRTGYEPLPLSDNGFIKWIDNQENTIANNWSWLLEEMYEVAKASKLKYRDILLLNLRAWQYTVYSGNASTACSNIAIKLTDGTIANAGALDDNSEFYCGIVKIIPKQGHSFMTFPITGTSWGNRGLNNAGLCVGVSSQILPNLNRFPGTICADIANRVILQTCTTVDDVREFCKNHPFNLNLLCSDKIGDIFAAHCTSAGLFEVTDKVMTNHVIDDRIRFKLQQQGISEFRESETTRLRRGRLLDYAANFSGKCSAEDLKKYIADRLDGDPASICPESNIVLTYTNPQAEPGVMWISEPQAVNNEKWIKYECFTK